MYVDVLKSLNKLVCMKVRSEQTDDDYSTVFVCAHVYKYECECVYVCMDVFVSGVRKV